MSNEDIDIGNILEALNNKADRDLSNLALEGGGVNSMTQATFVVL